MDHSTHLATKSSDKTNLWENLQDAFSQYGFMPHGHCYLWKPLLVSIHVISDALIGISYFAISIILYHLVKKIKLPFNGVILCFGIFIAACGLTHFLEIWNLWNSDYWWSAWIKVITALASVGTAIYIFRLRHDIVNVANAAKLAKEKQAELAYLHEKNKLELENVKEEFSVIADNISQLAWMTDESGFITWYNKRWYEYTGKTFEDMQGWGWEKVHDPKELPRIMSTWKIALENGEAWEDTFPLKGKNGEYRWFLSRAMPIKDTNGKITRWFGTNTDITENLNVETQLRASIKLNEEVLVQLKTTKEQLEQGMAMAKMGVWDIDLIEDELHVSESFNKIFGSPQNSLERHDFFSMVHPEDTVSIGQAREYAFQNQTEMNIEFRIIWLDGSVHWVSSRGRTIYNDQNIPIRMAGVMMNIDERKQSQMQLEELVRLRTQELVHAQAALVQSSKMSALGEMAGGIAHEINTPLAAITMKAQQIERRININGIISPAQLGKDASIISDTAKKIAKIITGLRSFARDGSHDPMIRVSANQLVENVLTLCKNRFENHQVQLRFNSTDEDLNFECRPVPIEQILLNLLNNAFDAVMDLPEKWIEIEVREIDDDILFTITDSGTAISEKIAQKIFQPFYTTKPIGKGTGMGLSISKGIVDDHNGTLTVDSTHDHARFIMKIPKNQPINNETTKLVTHE